MIFIFAVTFICILFILIDLVPIYKNKEWLVFWIYISIIVIVYTSVILIAADVKIPSPSVPIKKIITMIWRTG